MILVVPLLAKRFLFHSVIIIAAETLKKFWFRMYVIYVYEKFDIMCFSKTYIDSGA